MYIFCRHSVPMQQVVPLFMVTCDGWQWWLRT